MPHLPSSPPLVHHLHPYLQAEAVEDQDLEALEEELKQLEELFFRLYMVILTYIDYIVTTWLIKL
jgi:hypothetical protein